jgi:hypothetical protein
MNTPGPIELFLGLVFSIGMLLYGLTMEGE